MSKVTAKIKWQKGAPIVTLRISGTWDEVIQSLHAAAMNIKEQAIARGLVGMNRERRSARQFSAGDTEAALLAAGGDPAEYDDT